MKLSRFSFALLACSLAPAAFAQSNQISLYGIADASVRYANGLRDFSAAANSTTSVMSGVNQTSRWGLRGSEDLGGGLKAIFLLEGGYNVDTGNMANSTKLFDRFALLGLEGNWGSVVAGRNRTLLGDAIAPVDPLGMRIASFNPNINVAALSQAGFGVEFGPAASTTGAYRLDNSVKYVGKFSGLTVSGMYAFGEQKSARLLNSTGVSAQYQNGGLTVSGAYQVFHSITGQRLDAWVSGAAYRLGDVRASLTYSDSSADVTATTTTKNRTVGTGVTLPLASALELTAAYYDVRRQQTGKANDGFGRIVSFLEYSLSKRTKGYLEVDYTHWRDNYQGAANKSNARGVSLGLVTRF